MLTKKIVSEFLKPVAENALEAFIWETHMPISDCRFIGSGFFDKGRGGIPDDDGMGETKNFLFE